MSLTEPGGNDSEAKQDGTAVYEEQLRDILEPKHNGKAVAIDVESGEYVVDSSWAVAVRRLREQKSEGFIWVRFIGPATPAENALGARLSGYDRFRGGATPQQDKDEMIERALALYAERLKPQLEPAENGRAVAIHVPTGDYAVGKTHPEARRLLRERHAPDGGVVTMTIGPPTPEDHEMGLCYLAGSKAGI